MLAAGETVLLFPGGAREVFKRRNEDYQLFWPSKPEFIRMAVRHGATIVPFAAVAGSYYFLHTHTVHSDPTTPNPKP